MAFKSKVIIPKKGLIKSKLQQLEKALSGDNVVQVGIPQDTSPYPDGTPVSLVAAVHEFGADIEVTDKMRKFFFAIGYPLNRSTTHINIPERSFMRSTMREEQKKYVKFMRKSILRILTNRVTPEQAAAQLGQLAADDVRDKIYAIDTPPNSSMTKERKGSDNPLVDTGRLARSVTFEVRK